VSDKEGRKFVLDTLNKFFRDDEDMPYEELGKSVTIKTRGTSGEFDIPLEDEPVEDEDIKADDVDDDTVSVDDLDF
jgi:hypothetical protein